MSSGVLDPLAQAEATWSPRADEYDQCMVGGPKCRLLSRLWWAGGCMVICSECLPGVTNQQAWDIAVRTGHGPLPAMARKGKTDD